MMVMAACWYRWQRCRQLSIGSGIIEQSIRRHVEVDKRNVEKDSSQIERRRR